MTVKRTPKDVDPEALDNLRLFAGRTPGQALTLEQWEALGYGIGGYRDRAVTDDAIGTKPRPRGLVNEETVRE